MRRLIAQFGTIALALALTGGAAFADSEASANATQQSGGSNITLEGDGDLSATVTQTQTQSVGGDSNTPGDSTSADNAASSSDPSSPAPLKSGSAAIQSPQTPSSTSQTTQPSGGQGGTVIKASLRSTDRAGVVRQALQQAAETASAGGLALVPVTVANHPGAPTPSQNPIGLIGELQALLIGAVVPAARFITGNDLATRALPVAALLLILNLILVLRPSNSYVARLRRSGFLGAARSDVGAALLHFATPPEMGFKKAFITL